MAIVECSACNGTGYIGEGQTECEQCRGLGQYDTDWVGVLRKFSARVGLPSYVFHSYEILETIDYTEYTNLTDEQKDGMRILLSCGRVDLNDGKAGKVRLWGMFGEGTTTRANLEALLE